MFTECHLLTLPKQALFSLAPSLSTSWQTNSSFCFLLTNIPHGLIYTLFGVETKVTFRMGEGGGVFVLDWLLIHITTFT